MMFSVHEYQDFDCSRIPPHVGPVRVTHLPTGVTLTAVPETQDTYRGPRYWILEGGPGADWKAQIVESFGLLPGNIPALSKDHAKALGLPYETSEDRRFYIYNVGSRTDFVRAIACDDRPLPTWTEELVSILLKCRLVAGSKTEWQNKTPPRPKEIVFRVEDAPAHLQGMTLIVRYKDR